MSFLINLLDLARSIEKAQSALPPNTDSDSGLDPEKLDIVIEMLERSIMQFMQEVRSLRREVRLKDLLGERADNLTDFLESQALKEMAAAKAEAAQAVQFLQALHATHSTQTMQAAQAIQAAQAERKSTDQKSQSLEDGEKLLAELTSRIVGNQTQH